MEDRIYDIIESPLFRLPAGFDESAMTRLVNFVGDYLMCVDPREADELAARFYAAHAGMAPAARAVLAELLAETSI
jgi:hypothetical protein